MGHTPDRGTIREAIHALPLAGARGDENLLDERAANAALFDLASTGRLPERIVRIVTTVLDGIRPELTTTDSGNFVLTPDELRGALARSAIRAGTQVAFDIGVEFQDIQALEKLLSGPIVDPDAA